MPRRLRTGSSPAGGTPRCLSREEPDAFVFDVCKHFFTLAEEDTRRGVSRVVEAICARWGEKRLTRERVYPLVREGIRRGFLFLCPPLEIELAQRIVDYYGLDGEHERYVQVVNSGGDGAHDDVTAAAAQLLHSLIMERAERRRLVNERRRAEQQKRGELPRPANEGERARQRAKERAEDAIHIGMGVGASTKKVARHLKNLLQGDPNCPDFVIHALSPVGFWQKRSQPPPITFLDWWENGANKAHYVGVDAAPVVECDQYEKLKRHPAVRNAYRRAREIDIVITAFACADHLHAVFSHYLHSVDPDDITRSLLEEQGWIGDVLCLPFSETGPITLQRGVRSVVVFEIPELVAMAKAKDKDIILVGGPCSKCGETRSKALRPLIESPQLRIWTHLVTDVGTACQLVPEGTATAAPLRMGIPRRGG